MPNPRSKNTIWRKTLKCFYQKNPPPPQMEANWFLLATTVPPVPQRIQSRTEFIDQSQIFYLKSSRRVTSVRDLMKECLQSNPNITPSLKGQHKLPPSLIHKCKPINAVKHLYNLFIWAPKGQEDINSALIVFEIFLSGLTSSSFYKYLSRRCVRGWIG